MVQLLHLQHLHLDFHTMCGILGYPVAHEQNIDLVTLEKSLLNCRMCPKLLKFKAQMMLSV